LTNVAGAANLYYMDEIALSFYVGKWDQRTEDIYLLRSEGGHTLSRGSSLSVWFSALRFRDWLRHVVTFRRNVPRPRDERKKPSVRRLING
jgi:hypothetical protein